MATILPFLRDPAVFEPEVTQAMAAAFDEVCSALRLSETATSEREILASKIIDLARRGERSSLALAERVMRDISVAAMSALPRQTA